MKVASGRKARFPRRAAVAVQIALCLTMLLGVGALVVDDGLLMAERRHAQAVADSAALAAATDLYKRYATNNGSDPLGQAAVAARGVATNNGYSNDGTKTVVTVNVPPKASKNAYFNNKLGYAEVTVTAMTPRGFSGIWGTSTLNVSGWK